MSTLVKSPKDFWTGVMYLCFGTAAVYLARDYGMGAAARMGPGYFPTVLGGLLLLFGAASVIMSFTQKGEPIGEIAWKPILFVVGSTAIFAFLLRPAGLVPALIALILVSASGSARFRFEWRATLAMIGLVGFCSLIFVKGLGVPMPLLGTWFGA